jgi:hypothetical protein
MTLRAYEDTADVHALLEFVFVQGIASLCPHLACQDVAFGNDRGSVVLAPHEALRRERHEPNAKAGLELPNAEAGLELLPSNWELKALQRAVRAWLQQTEVCDFW